MQGKRVCVVFATREPEATTPVSPPLLKSDSTPHCHTGFSAAPGSLDGENDAHSFSLHL